MKGGEPKLAPFLLAPLDRVCYTEGSINKRRCQVRRVFLEMLTAGFSQTAAATPRTIGDSFKAQEDLTLVGAFLGAWVNLENENDGFAECAFNLSMDGTVWEQLILEANASEGWNTTPAGICKQDGRHVVMFPAGHGVTLKEGESVYLCYDGRGKSAGTTGFFGRAGLFLVKGV